MYNIAWYARDGHKDLFPQIASRLKEMGSEFTSHYLCNHEVDGDHLRSNYQVEDPWVVGTYLQENQSRFDVSQARIRELEAEYDAIALRRCLWGESSILGLPESAVTRNLVGHFDFWETFLLTNKIDMLVSERPSILSTCVAWLVCKRHGIDFLDFIDIPLLADRMAVSSSWEGYYDGLEEQLNSDEIVEGSVEHRKAVEYLETWRARPQKTPEALAKIELERKTTGISFYLMNSPALSIKAPGLLRRIHRKSSSYYLDRSSSRRFAAWLRTYLNRLRLAVATVFDTKFRPEDERYWLMPLHRSGEWSHYTFMGPRYSDQASLVRDIASCLPLGTKLYVKEHTSGFGERPVSFYGSLRRAPQVRVVGPQIDTFHLIRNSLGVVTLGSSMGFEALLLDKPVIISGEPWYRNFPGVYKGDRPEVLAELLQNAHRLSTPTEAEKLKMVYALFKVSFDGVKVPHEDTLKPENITQLAKALEGRIKSGPKVTMVPGRG